MVEECKAELRWVAIKDCSRDVGCVVKIDSRFLVIQSTHDGSSFFVKFGKSSNSEMIKCRIRYEYNTTHNGLYKLSYHKIFKINHLCIEIVFTKENYSLKDKSSQSENLHFFKSTTKKNNKSNDIVK